MQQAFAKMEAQMKTWLGVGPGPGFSNEMARMTAMFGAISSVGFAVVGASTLASPSGTEGDSVGPRGTL